jgi:RND family efflux transporter MFP subunit
MSGVLSALVIFTGCNSSKDPVQDPVNVEVQKAVVADERQDFSYSGTIEESETIPLSFSSVGAVLHVYVSEGDAVHKGQLLASLDNTTAKNAYEMAHATEQQAEDAYNRLTPMHKNGNLSEVKYVEVETGLHQAKAAAAIAKKILDDCNLYATTDGYIGKRSVDPGMTALPNLASITIVKISKVYARVSIAENEIASIKKGQRASVMVGALGAAEYNGTVEEIGVVADPLAHTYKIKIGVGNPNRDIKSGMICVVRLSSPSGIHGIEIPSAAVMVNETGINYVYVVDSVQRRASRRAVQTGKLLANGIEALRGVNAGELIVTAGQHKLVDNSPVCIVSR